MIDGPEIHDVHDHPVWNVDHVKILAHGYSNNVRVLTGGWFTYDCDTKELTVPTNFEVLRQELLIVGIRHECMHSKYTTYAHLKTMRAYVTDSLFQVTEDVRIDCAAHQLFPRAQELHEYIYSRYPFALPPDAPNTTQNVLMAIKLYGVIGTEGERLTPRMRQLTEQLREVLPTTEHLAVVKQLADEIWPHSRDANTPTEDLLDQLAPQGIMTPAERNAIWKLIEDLEDLQRTRNLRSNIEQLIPAEDDQLQRQIERAQEDLQWNAEHLMNRARARQQAEQAGDGDCMDGEGTGSEDTAEGEDAQSAHLGDEDADGEDTTSSSSPGEQGEQGEQDGTPQDSEDPGWSENAPPSGPGTLPRICKSIPRELPRELLTGTAREQIIRAFRTLQLADRPADEYLNSDPVEVMTGIHTQDIDRVLIADSIEEGEDVEGYGRLFLLVDVSGSQDVSCHRGRNVTRHTVLDKLIGELAVLARVHQIDFQLMLWADGAQLLDGAHCRAHPEDIPPTRAMNGVLGYGTALWIALEKYRTVAPLHGHPELALVITDGNMSADNLRALEDLQIELERSPDRRRMVITGFASDAELRRMRKGCEEHPELRRAHFDYLVEHSNLEALSTVVARAVEDALQI